MRYGIGMSPSLRQAAIRVVLNMLYVSGAYRLARKRWEGVGLVLTLHHVRPARGDPFQPNRSLEVTPEFLDLTITGLRQQGVEFVSLDEVHRRLCSGDVRQRFASVTFDDGYRDNLEWAYPILRRHQVPFTVFVVSDFADGRGHLWWRTVERALAANEKVSIPINGARHTFSCGSTAEKYAAARAIDRELAAVRSEKTLRAAVQALAIETGIDLAADCAAACMGWHELANLAADPLVAIGAHTVSHPNLRSISTAEARREMEESAAHIERALGFRPAHFAYPFGHPGAAAEEEFALAAEAGFKTAVTTRPGVLFAGSQRSLTALPRISLNGHFQRLRYVQVLASGVATSPLRRRVAPAPD